MTSNKTIALVTGANKGIGLETARQLAQAGLKVYIAGRNQDAAQEATKELRAAGLDVQAIQLDVLDADSIASAAKKIGEEDGRLDVLVNNAGIMRDAFDKKPSAQELPMWRDTFDTNLFGVVAVTQAVLPLILKSQQGRIVNVSSVLGSMGANVDPSSDFYDFKIPAYNISKTALNAWTVHLAYELKNTPVKVNAAHPGFVKTDLHGVDAPMSPEQGAKTSVRLALLPADGPTGAFYHEEKILPW